MDASVESLTSAAGTVAGLFGSGGMAVVLILSYAGKLRWKWQVDELLAAKDVIIEEHKSTIVKQSAEIVEHKKREDDDNNQYREVAWAALTTAKETASVGKEIVSAVRARRG